MKFIFMGDFHNEESTPYARIDNWQETLDLKAQEIQDIAHSINARAILQTGDFLNRPKIQEAYMQTILNRWNHVKPNELLLNETTLEGKIPMIGIVGNHELFGNSLNNFNKTSLAVLEEIGFLRLVDRKPLFLEENGLKIAITGTGYYPGIDRDVNGFIVKEKLGDVHIHIVHGYGTFKNLGELIPHTDLTKYAAETKADITIIGHDHIGFGIKNIDGKFFVNPGAVTRLTAANEEIDREVRIGIIDIDASYESGYNVELVPLKTAKTGTEVLSREHIINQKNKEEFAKKIVEQVEKVKVNSHTTIKDIVDEIAQNSNIDDHVKNGLLERFNEKMQNEQVPSPVNSYRIKSLHLVNFQSHKDTKFDFGKLNVFTGPSGSGKTAVLRAFSWILEDKVKNSRRLIHKDEPFASATIELDSGMKVTRKVERKKTGFNGYLIEYPDGTKESLNTKGLAIIQKLLGFNYLATTEEKTQANLNLNFLKQGEGWFFIGPEITGSERAKMIGAIYKTHIADAVQKDLNLESKRNSVLLKEKEAESEKLKLDIETMCHIEKMEACISEAEPLIIQLEALKEKLKKYDELILKKNLLEEKIRSVDTALNDLQHAKEAKELLLGLRHRIFVLGKLEQASSVKSKCYDVANALSCLQNVVKPEKEIADLKNKIQKYQKVVELNQRKKHLYDEMFRIKATVDMLQELSKHHEYVTDLKQKVKLQNEINSKLEDLKNSINKMNDNRKKIEFLDDLDGILRPRIKDLKTKIEQYQTVNSLWSKAADIDALITSNNKELKETKKELSALKHDYWDGLKELDVCPTCLQKINEETRTNMARSRTK